jgi:hypothetical protein
MSGLEHRQSTSTWSPRARDYRLQRRSGIAEATATAVA